MYYEMIVFYPKTCCFYKS